MIGRAEEPALRLEEWADDDVGREYVDLAGLEELDDALEEPAARLAAEPWRTEPAGEVSLDAAPGLDLLASLEAGDEWPLEVAAPEPDVLRVARRLEGLEAGAFDALAPYRGEGEPADEAPARDADPLA